MPFNTLQNELKDIAEELAAIDKPDLFGKKLKHRLMGCIDENPVLKKEFERRNRIYPHEGKTDR